LSKDSQQKTKEQSQIIFQNGLRLLQQGNLEEADKLFMQAHVFDEQNIDVLNLLGIRAYQKSDNQNALKFLQRADKLAPHSAHTLSNLGLVYIALSEFQSALKFFDQAIACDANIPETHNNRGNALKGLNRTQEALSAYQQALLLRPNYGEALSNQGVIFLDQGYPDKAVPLFERALEANPNLATAYNNLGNALTQMELYDSAFQCFERALQIYPSYLDACLNFGSSLKKSKQYSAAIDCYQHALKINPGYAKTYYALGEIYYDTGDCDLAKTYHAKSIDLDPANLQAQYALTIAQIPKVYKNTQEVVDSKKSFAAQLQYLKAINHLSRSREEILNILTRHPFYLAYQDENNEPLISEYGKLCSEHAKYIQNQLKATQKNPQSDTKIRIGIVSRFFHQHPVWNAITKGLVSHLNSDKFEVHLFNTNGTEDSETEFAKAKTARYLNCTNSVDQAAQAIIAQNLDVLLYPEIGMDVTSKALACLRLAPTQIVSWGHPETTGLPTIDFYLSAQGLEPDNGGDFYSEKLIRLSNLGTYFENEFVRPVDPDLASLGIEPSVPILLCAGSPSKYLPSYDSLLVEIAQKVDKCQFIFFSFDENLTAILRERLTDAFANAKLDVNRFVRFIPFLKKEAFYGLMQKADLYLDTVGFSGFNTAMQAIACDLPIVTVEGSKMRGRLASAILNQIGLEDLICHSNRQYVDLAADLIQNKELLRSYKDKITQSKETLFNDLTPIRALEDFLTQHIRK
jgi:protein O-GlcNAc transferase